MGNSAGSNSIAILEQALSEGKAMGFRYRVTRRDVLRAAGSAAGFCLVPTTVWSGEKGLQLTPDQTDGPFYPVTIPLDNDNDLVTVTGRADTANGIVANVVGRVIDDRGQPINQAQIEIWQCDANGRYHHPGDKRDVPRDDNFQGFGQYITGDDGAYRFRTIKPVPYPGRTPHIHFKIKGPGIEPLSTQLYVAGESGNAKDGIYNSIKNEPARKSVTVPFEEDPVGTGELVAYFEIVLAADGRFEHS